MSSIETTLLLLLCNVSRIIGIPLSKTHSGSFDSVNTTTSFGTERNSFHHSNSMDSLIHKKTKSSRAQPKGKASIPRRKENGKTYDSLMESASAVTTFSACDRNKELSRSYPEVATQLESTQSVTEVHKRKIPINYDETSRKCVGDESHSRHSRGNGSPELQKNGKISNNFLVDIEPETISGLTDHVHGEHSLHAVSVSSYM